MIAPKVSIIIPAYNAEKFIEETINSVLKQTFQNFEIIVVDDGSRDKTAEIVKDLTKKDKRIKYFYQKNQGVSAARNKAIKYSRGEFIALLDNDDIWMPQKTEEQISLFNKNKKLGLVFSKAVFIHGGRDLYPTFRRGVPKGKIFEDLLKKNFITCPTIMIKKEALIKLGKFFDKKLRMIEDYDLCLRIAKDWEIDYVDKFLAKWRSHQNNFTYMNRELLFLEREYMLKKFKKLYPEFEKKYKEGLKYFKKQIDYQKALYYWQKGDARKSREFLRRYFISDLKLPYVYFLTLFPYEFLMNLKQILRRFIYFNI